MTELGRTARLRRIELKREGYRTLDLGPRRRDLILRAASVEHSMRSPESPTTTECACSSSIARGHGGGHSLWYTTDNGAISGADTLTQVVPFSTLKFGRNKGRSLPSARPAISKGAMVAVFDPSTDDRRGVRHATSRTDFCSSDMTAHMVALR